MDSKPPFADTEPGVHVHGSGLDVPCSGLGRGAALLDQLGPDQVPVAGAKIPATDVEVRLAFDDNALRRRGLEAFLSVLYLS